MAMDFETVKYLRRLFGVLFACVGAAAGYKYYGTLGAVVGVFVGFAVGSSVVDLFKGRAQK